MDQSISPEKQELLELEKTGFYVFHGSDSEIEEFEPRQAFNYLNDKHIPDGEPAIFASSVADYAVLMALINERNCPKGYHSSAGTSTNTNEVVSVKYRASKSSLAQLNKNSFGWVYVFDRKFFTQRDRGGGVEYVSLVPIRPARKIKVSKLDLPESLEVFD